MKIADLVDTLIPHQGLQGQCNGNLFIKKRKRGKEKKKIEEKTHNKTYILLQYIDNTHIIHLYMDKFDALMYN